MLYIDERSGIAAVRVKPHTEELKERLGNGLHGDEVNTLAFVSGRRLGLNAWQISENKLAVLKKALEALTTFDFWIEEDKGTRPQPWGLTDLLLCCAQSREQVLEVLYNLDVEVNEGVRWAHFLAERDAP